MRPSAPGMPQCDTPRPGALAAHGGGGNPVQLRRLITASTSMMVLLGIASCDGASDTPSRTSGSAADSLAFELVNVFGPLASAVPMGEVAASAPVIDTAAPLLIAPSTAGVGSEGQIFVLDSRARRIYVFDGDGSPTGAIGAMGEGPGEMAQPISFSLTDDGRLVVSDIQLRRVTVYNSAGDLISTTPVTRNGITALEQGGVITILTDFGPSSNSAGVRYSLDGTVLGDYGHPTERDRELARSGHFGWLSALPNSSGTLRFSGAPGTWSRHDSSGQDLGRRGVELFPTAGFGQLDQGDGVPLSYSTAGTMTAGVTDGGASVFIGYFSDLMFGKHTPARHDYQWGVALFDSSGTLLARGSLPPEWGMLRAVGEGPDGNLLLTVSEPEPHVAEVRLMRIPGRRTTQ